MSLKYLGEILFRYRSYTPIPLLALLLIFGKPTMDSLIVGVVFLFFGELIRIWAQGYIGGASRTRVSSELEKLVVCGPYAYIRNPLYLGNFILVNGYCYISNNLYLWVLTITLFFVQYMPIIFSEEQSLTDAYGESYRDYRRKTGCFLPKGKYKTEDRVKFDLKEGLINERTTIAAIILLYGIMIVRFYVWK